MGNGAATQLMHAPPPAIPSEDAYRLVHEVVPEIEHAHKIQILWIVESGSRAYGLHSEHSDLDPRGVFRYTDDAVRDELTVPGSKKFRRVITTRDASGKIDLQLWEYGFAMGKLREKNPSIMDWLYSPPEMVYLDKSGAFTHWQTLQPREPADRVRHYLRTMNGAYSKGVDPFRDTKSAKKRTVGIQLGKADEALEACHCNDENMEKKLSACIEALQDTLRLAKEDETDHKPTERSRTTAKTMWFFLRPYLMLAHTLQHPEAVPRHNVLDIIENTALGDDGLILALYTHRRAAGNAKKDAELLDPPDCIVRLYTEMRDTAIEYLKGK
mgnify:CR=1 FL=1